MSHYFFPCFCEGYPGSKASPLKMITNNSDDKHAADMLLRADLLRLIWNDCSGQLSITAMNDDEVDRCANKDVEDGLIKGANVAGNHLREHSTL